VSQFAYRVIAYLLIIVTNVLEGRLWLAAIACAALSLMCADEVRQKQ
jgi:hypothetical protein